MKRFTLKQFGLFSALFASSLAAQAIEKPVLPTQELTSGEKYVLFNLARPDGYWSRTGWDGAFYLLGPDDSNYANHQLQAVDNGDGTWAFTMSEEVTVEVTPEEGSEVDTGTTTTETVVTYMGIGGSANLNMLSESAVWTVAKSDVAGYYHLIAGAGNNETAVGHHLHLNNGTQYVVVSFPGDAWYPDFAVKTDENGVNVSDEESGFYEMADSTQINWAFVKADEVPVYAARTTAYATITNFEETYIGMEGYDAGFKLSLDAATAVYENADFEPAWKDSISTIINGKLNLYLEIEKALEVNTTGDATLAAAINAAQSVFDTTVSATELEAAVATLVKAEAAYGQGQGDYTSLGKNMSFEDLSAQGGNTTTGVGNPPYGWTLIVGGDTCLTADEIKAAGIANWCGVNGDCTGETKDGNYGFGIWTAGFPTVQLSQTITGIENGTYEISAALMVGANGNGSRRTTQRIFGNLNSAYFAGEADYNVTLLDDSEVYSFAGLVEPTTDTEMYPITVRAYVYDGTLTFGLRTDGNVRAANRDNSNSAGGDGWFKVDNFRIAKVGYDVNDALAVLNHYIDLLDDRYWNTEALPTATGEKIEAALAELRAHNASSTQEEINAGINSAIALLAEIEPEVAAYRALQEAIAEAYVQYEIYSEMPGATRYQEVIGEIEMNFYDGVYDIPGTVAAIAQLEAALEDCKKSQIEVGKDITYLLVNPSFENQVATQPNGDTGGVADAPKGWTLIINGDTCRTADEIKAQNVTGWCAINGGDEISVDVDGVTITQQPTDGSKLWGIWTEFLPEVELSQTLTGLPKGTYTLTADVMVQYNWAGDNITTQRIFGNQFVQMFSYDGMHEANLPADAQWGKEADAAFPDLDYDFTTYAGYTCENGDATTSLLRPMSVKFVVDETGVAKVGFRTNGINVDGVSREDGGRSGQGWFKVDNFTLTYDSETVPEKVAQGIEESVVEAAADVVARQYYTIGGAQVNKLPKGIVIVKEILANGTVKVSKQIVK